MSDEYHIAIAGHPGSGKTTLAVAMATLDARSHTIVDLPGAHSLIPRTVADREVYDTWYGPDVDAAPSRIVVVVEALKIRQQLSLVSQLIDLHRPLVVVLRETGEASKAGISIRADKLSALLGVPVVASSSNVIEDVPSIMQQIGAHKGEIDALAAPHWRPSHSLADAFNKINRSWLVKNQPDKSLRLIEGLRILTDPSALDEYQHRSQFDRLAKTVNEVRDKMESQGENWTMAEISQRNAWLTHIYRQCITNIPVEKRADSAPATKRIWRKMFKIR